MTPSTGAAPPRPAPPLPSRRRRSVPAPFPSFLSSLWCAAQAPPCRGGGHLGRVAAGARCAGPRSAAEAAAEPGPEGGPRFSVSGPRRDGRAGPRVCADLWEAARPPPRADGSAFGAGPGRGPFLWHRGPQSGRDAGSDPRAAATF